MMSNHNNNICKSICNRQVPTLFNTTTLRSGTNEVKCQGLWNRNIVDMLRGVRTCGETPLEKLIPVLGLNSCECCPQPLDLKTFQRNHPDLHQAALQLQSTTASWLLDATAMVTIFINGSEESFPGTVYSTECKGNNMASKTGLHRSTCGTCYSLLHPSRGSDGKQSSKALYQLLYRRREGPERSPLGVVGKTIAHASWSEFDQGYRSANEGLRVSKLREKLPVTLMGSMANLGEMARQENIPEFLRIILELHSIGKLSADMSVWDETYMLHFWQKFRKEQTGQGYKMSSLVRQASLLQANKGGLTNAGINAKLFKMASESTIYRARQRGIQFYAGYNPDLFLLVAANASETTSRGRVVVVEDINAMTFSQPEAALLPTKVNAFVKEMSDGVRIRRVLVELRGCLLGAAYPHLLRNFPATEGLAIPTDWDELYTLVQGYTHAFPSELPAEAYIHAVSSGTTVTGTKPPRIVPVSAAPHSSKGFTGMHLLRNLAQLRYDAGNSTTPVVLLPHSTDCIGYSASAARLLMTPTAERIASGVRYVGFLGKKWSVYIPYENCEFPAAHLLDWDHVGRTGRRNLRNTKIQITFWACLHTGPAQQPLVNLSISEQTVAGERVVEALYQLVGQPRAEELILPIRWVRATRLSPIYIDTLH